MPSLNYLILLTKKKSKKKKSTTKKIIDKITNDKKSKTVEKIKKRVEKAFITQKNIISIKYKNANLDLTDAYVRTWINRDKIPYFYEFRGNSYAGYLKPNELIIVCNS